MVKTFRFRAYILGIMASGFMGAAANSRLERQFRRKGE